MPRRLKDTPESRSRFLELVRAGGTLEKAAAGAGFSTQSLARWRKADSGFDAAIIEAEVDRVAICVEVVTGQARPPFVSSTRTVTSPDGTKIEEVKYAPIDWEQAIHIIRNTKESHLRRLIDGYGLHDYSPN